MRLTDAYSNMDATNTIHCNDKLCNNSTMEMPILISVLMIKNNNIDNDSSESSDTDSEDDNEDISLRDCQILGAFHLGNID